MKWKLFWLSASLILPLSYAAPSHHAHHALSPFSIPGIDLENIVYYKDDTHYFVMTAKKESLLKKGVIKQVRTTHPLPGRSVIPIGTSCVSGR